MKLEYSLQNPTMTPTDIDVQNVKRPKDYRHSFRQGRTKHGFIYVAAGCYSISMSEGDRETLSATAGELIFVPKGTRYTGLYLEEGTEIKLVQFDLVESELPSYLEKPKKLAIPNAAELIDPFFASLKSRSSPHPFYYLSCLYALLWQIDEVYARMPSKYKKLSPAFYELAENWQKNEPVSYYAELCNMSEANLRRLFREYTGMSPIEYRNDLRLKSARGKLQSGEYNVSETAELCGFQNLSFFIRLYKKKFGTTPKKG